MKISRKIKIVAALAGIALAAGSAVGAFAIGSATATEAATAQADAVRWAEPAPGSWEQARPLVEEWAFHTPAGRALAGSFDYVDSMRGARTGLHCFRADFTQTDGTHQLIDLVVDPMLTAPDSPVLAARVAETLSTPFYCPTFDPRD